MQIFKRCAVVGADGVIGRSLLKSSSRIAEEIIGTTRRAGVQTLLQLDLASGCFDNLLQLRPDVAFLCAGITAMSDCENNPERSRQVNVVATTKLAQQLLAQDCFVIFLSSNTVFDGRGLWPDETAAYSPCNEYGRQKVAAEEALMALPEARGRLAIVRLSKVLRADQGIIGDLLQQLARGRPGRLFSDLNLSPVSLRYVTESLVHVAIRHKPGVFHISGTQELSYAEFAKRFATRLGYDANLIEPVDSVTAGAAVLFRPEHPGLGMRLTMQSLGLTPESLEQMLDALIDRGHSGDE